MNPELSIIIVSYNTAGILRDCLLSIAKHTRCRYECIVVDNASSDGTCQMVVSECAGVNLIQNSTNRGFAAANNQGLQVALGGYVVFLNSDTIITEGALDIMLNTLRSNTTIGILGPHVLNGDGVTQQASVFRFPTARRLFFSNLPFQKIVPIGGWESHAPYIQTFSGAVEVISGCCMMMPTELARRIGGMNEEYFMYSEELDLCKAVQRLGYKTFYTQEATIIHLGGASTQVVSEKMAVELLRSMMKYLEREEPDAIRWVRWWYILGSSWRMIVWAIMQIVHIRHNEARQKRRVHLAMVRWLLFRFDYRVKP